MAAAGKIVFMIPRHWCLLEPVLLGPGAGAAVFSGTAGVGGERSKGKEKGKSKSKSQEHTAGPLCLDRESAQGGGIRDESWT